MSNAIEIVIGVAGGNLAVEALSKVSDALGGLADKVSPAFGAVASAAAVATGAIVGFSGAVFELVRSTADAGDHIWEVSQKLGVSAQTLSELDYTAKMSGASLDDLRTAFSLLSRRVSEASTGVDGASKPFRALGIEARDVNSALKPVDVLFLEVTDKLKNVSSETQKTALMFELFGRGGTALLPMLKGGSAEMAKLREEARRLGITFNNVQAQQANDFGDSLLKIRSSVNGLVKAFSLELMPTLTVVFDGLADKLTAFLPTAKAWGRKLIEYFMVIPDFFSELGTLIDRLLTHMFTDTSYFIGFLNNLLKLGGVIKATFEETLWQLAIMVLKASSVIWVPLGEAATVANDHLRYGFELLIDYIQTKILAAALWIVSTANNILPKAFQIDTTYLSTALENVLNDTAKVPKTIAAAMAEGKALITGMFVSMSDNFSAIKDSIANVFTVGKSVIKDFAQLPEMKIFLSNMDAALKDAANKIDGFAKNAEKKVAGIQQSVATTFDKLSAIWMTHFDKDAKSILLKMNDTGKHLTTNWSAVMDRINDVSRKAWTDFKSGVGDAIGAAIVYGEDLGKAFNNLMLKITAGVISMLIQVGLEMLAQWAIGAALLITETAAKLSAAIAVGTANAMAWGAAVGGPIGAGLSASAFLAIVPEYMVMSKVMGQTMAPFVAGAAHGGLESVPAESTFLLQKGERVLSPNQNKDLKDYMAQRDRGSVVIQQLNILPNSSIDEALMNKPPEWWRETIRKNILPAMNSLGDMGYSTTLKQRRSKI